MKFVVDQNKLRLDRFLAQNVANVSRSRIQRDIESGQVQVNGKTVSEGKHVVRSSDVIEYDFKEQPKISAKPLEIKVLYENDQILIIDKPAGLVIHPAPGYKGVTLAEGLLYKYKDIKVIGDLEIRPGIVHRLDKDTSGVLLVAKTQEMFEYLKDAFATRNIKKQYIALVCGHVQPRHGVINEPIGRHPRDFRKMATKNPSEPKDALTEYSVVEYFKLPNADDPSRVDEYTLLNVKLHTGRTHQIRVHFSSLDHPIAGDALYGKGSAPGLKRQFLHASRIELKLPDGAWIEAESELPADLREVLNNLRRLTK